MIISITFLSNAVDSCVDNHVEKLRTERAHPTSFTWFPESWYFLVTSVFHKSSLICSPIRQWIPVFWRNCGGFNVLFYTTLWKSVWEGGEKKKLENFSTGRACSRPVTIIHGVCNSSPRTSFSMKDISRDSTNCSSTSYGITMISLILSTKLCWFLAWVKDWLCGFATHKLTYSVSSWTLNCLSVFVHQHAYNACSRPVSFFIT